MRKPKRQSIRRALCEMQEQLAQQDYPGDLANDVLEQRDTPSRRQLLRYPALATALLALGLTIGIVLMPPQQPETNSTPHTANTAPVLPSDPQPTPVIPTAQTPVVPMPTPAVLVANHPLPEIDRGLLPVSRNRHATWLASPKAHRSQIQKQSQLAANPDPDQRVRVSFSTPSRRSIDRTFSRTRSVKPNPKTERTS